MYCYKNGSLCFDLHLEDRGFFYGDGCFTTARIENGDISLWRLHHKRLIDAVKRLDLKFKIPEIEQYKKLFLAELAMNNLPNNGTLKIIISRGVGGRGYKAPDISCDIYFYFYPEDPKQLKQKISSVKADILDMRLGIISPSLQGIKTLNRIEQVMLQQELDRKRIKEGIVADINDMVVEGVASNCFLFKGNQWITPDLASNGIEGVMRHHLLERFSYFHIKHQVRPIHLSDLEDVKSIFFCNSLNPLLPASHLGKQELDLELTAELYQKLLLS